MNSFTSTPPDSEPTVTRDTQASKIVYCSDDFGVLHKIPEENLLFQPAVYGIYIENNQILLQKHIKTDLYHPPGGLVVREQAPKQALRQHYRAATGMMPVIDSLILVDDVLHFDGTDGKRLTVMYYLLDRPNTGLANLIDFNNESRPEWVPLSALDRIDMQFGYDAIQSGLLLGA